MVMVVAVVFVFVVQFAQFNVVMVVAVVFGGLQGSVDHGDNFVEAGEFLVLFFLLTILHADLFCDVESQGIHDVTKVEQVELSLAMPIVDLTDLLNSISISHFDGFYGSSLIKHTLIVTTAYKIRSRSEEV